MKELTHRDEIHGDVVYDPIAVALLDTPALQRLGRVYQLGYGHLVYRGGTHTRLSHSLGAYHTAARLTAALHHNYTRRQELPTGALKATEFLPRKPEDSRSGRAPRPAVQPRLVDDVEHTPAEDRWEVLRHLVSWSALLHDVGHVPLGHTLEDEFDGIYEKHDDWGSPRLAFLWLQRPGGGTPEIRQVFNRVELYPEAFHDLGLRNPEDVWGTVFLICMFKEVIAEGTRSEFEDLLEKKRVELVKRELPDERLEVVNRLSELYARLKDQMFFPYMADIVANTISADYLDYLRRDPHNLGLDVLRDDRVVSRFWIGKDHHDQPRMALSLVDRRGKRRLDTCTGVVELVRQRYRFAEIVYYHKTKVAASAMLAKVFHLIDKPQEVPAADRHEMSLRDTKSVVADITNLQPRSQQARLDSLRVDILPSALLDPEVGDESLLVILLQDAWNKFETAIRNKESEDAERALQALSLLQGILRRRLYKVAMTLDADQFQALSSSPKEDADRSLGEFVRGLREGEVSARRRADLEAKMVAAAGSWPSSSIILYVPDRKSQAKGIETGALSGDRVVTLGRHSAVEGEVKELNARYKGLWRFIVLAHPDYERDVLGLSDAIDAFVEDQFPSCNLSSGAVVDLLRDACWFRYVAGRDRPTGRIYERLDPTPEWELLSDFLNLVEGHTSNEEIAAGSYLLRTLAARTGSAVRASSLVHRDFGSPGSLAERMRSEIAEVGVAALRSTEESDVLATRAVLDRIAEGMVLRG